ncbi:hypothetical protein RND81_14G158300 [Saponaria officinalis]|uniref:Avr9/Cf-9 rapidly elicited protein n=1 Tax=Saponaria officinalis TaxID=3572 RepID=A0AAW1GQA0_SAPOF
MDQNLPIVSKKLLNMMRVVFYILKKSINKKKLLLDLNLLIKRGKFVAGKTLTNLLFHHNHHNNHHVSATFEDEYEFSCTNSPLYRHYFTTTTKSKTNHLDQIVSVEDKFDFTGLRSPVARKLRITDSPYPVNNEGGDVHVDAAAEEFIKRFYSQLRQQSC